MSLGAHTSAHSITALTAFTTTTPKTTSATGSTFYVFVSFNSGTIVVTDTFGNTYSQVNTTVSSGGAQYEGALFKSAGASGGASHTWTATFSGGVGAQFSSLFVVEDTGSPTVDQELNGIFDNATPFTSNTTATTAQAVELLIAFTTTGTNTAGPEVLTWGNGFTQLDAEPDGNFVTGATASLVTSSVGTYQASFTSAGAGTNDAIVFLVALKESGGGGGGASSSGFLVSDRTVLMPDTRLLS
jgi:hypothetical protein